MRKSLFVPALSLVLAAASPLFSAEPTKGPPKVLQIFVEHVKPGKGSAHAKIEAGWPAAFAKAKIPAYTLAMTASTGSSEAWFIVGHDSFAAAEKIDEMIDKNAGLKAELDRLSEKDGELLTKTSGMLATYREDLSFHAEVDLPKMRYFSITTVQIRPGHVPDLEAARKIVNEAHEKAHMDEHWAVFEVVSGAPASTFLFFIPMKSMAELDAVKEMHGKAYQDVLGEENQKKLRDYASAAIVTSESRLFSFSPKMSYPRPEFAAADPAFWTPKPAKAAATPAAAKDAKKAPAKAEEKK